VFLLDANVLLYAANSEAEHHKASATWLRKALNGDRPVGFAWVVLLAFLRISTHRSMLDRPITSEQALDLVDDWLGAPASVVLSPTGRHLGVLRGLLLEAGSGGNLVNDAHLAAVAAEHGATVVTFDRDFARFPGVLLHRPGD
jgi:toxin-antitoxin system PIN domain toxin